MPRFLFFSKSFHSYNETKSDTRFSIFQTVFPPYTLNTAIATRLMIFGINIKTQADKGNFILIFLITKLLENG